MSLSITAEASSTVEVSVGGETVAEFVASGNTHDIELDLAEGTFVVSVIATDAAGNRSLAGTRTVEVDLSPPAAPGLDVDVEDHGVEVRIAGQPHADFAFVLSGPDRESGSGRLPGGGEHETFVELGPGDYELVATLSDPGGQSAETSMAFVVTGPPPPPPSVDVTIDGDLVTLAASASSGDVVEFEVRAEGGDVRTEGAGHDGGRALTTLQLRDGDFSVVATTTNRHGAVSEASVATPFSVDTTPSALAAKQLDAGPDVLSLSIVAESGSQVSITIESVDLAETVGGEGTPQVLTFDMPPGDHVVRITAADEAGNVSSTELFASVPRSYVVPAALVGGGTALAAAGTGVGWRRRRRSALAELSAGHGPLPLWATVDGGSEMR